MIKFDLEKSTEKLQLTLQKHNVQTIVPCQVALAFDVSGSFDVEHFGGYTQQLLNRLVPFSMLFDKDKTLESHVFSGATEQLDDIDITNYSSYIRRHVVASSCYNGGTNYKPVLENMLQLPRKKKVVEDIGFFGKLFGKKPVVTEVEINTELDDKKLCFFVTDGEAWDANEAKMYLDKTLGCGNTKNFIVFITIGGSEFKFFKNNYKDTKYSSYFNLTPNELRTLESASDEDLFEKIITPQLTAWMEK